MHDTIILYLHLMIPITHNYLNQIDRKRHVLTSRYKTIRTQGRLEQTILLQKLKQQVKN